MTSRIGKPNTETDTLLHQRLVSDGSRHFVMVAGAGSGKTTSLVKALAQVERTRGPTLRLNGQKIACITYTEVAVEEIRGDVGTDELFHVSTIHSFLWAIIKPFQNDLRNWVRGRLQKKISDEQEKIDKPRTREATKVRSAEAIERYRRQLTEIDSVKNFRYGTGSDYANGVLGHSDILKMGPEFIAGYPLMQTVLTQRFPIIFVDESQDTEPAFVEALRHVARAFPLAFALVFSVIRYRKYICRVLVRYHQKMGGNFLKSPKISGARRLYFASLIELGRKTTGFSKHGDGTLL